MRPVIGRIAPGSVRATPPRVPTIRAMIHAPSARPSVQPRPLRTQSRYCPVPSGVDSNSKDMRGSLAGRLVARRPDQAFELLRLGEVQVDFAGRDRVLEP